MGKKKMKMCLLCGRDAVEAAHLFCLPNNPQRVSLWEKSLGVILSPYNKNKKICNFHFTDDSFLPFRPDLKLKPDAVPMRWCNSPVYTQNNIKENVTSDAIDNSGTVKDISNQQEDQVIFDQFETEVEIDAPPVDDSKPENDPLGPKKKIKGGSGIKRKYKWKKNREKVDGNEVFEITTIDQYDYNQSILEEKLARANSEDVYIDFNRICLTCLSSENEMTNIKDVSFGEITGKEVYEKYVSILLEDDDELPKQICTNCLYDLCRIYSFVNTCKESYATLKETISKVEEDELCNFTPINTEQVEPSNNNPEPIQNPEEILKLGPLKVDEPGPPFICEVCSEHFDNLKDIRLHRQKRKHLKIRQYLCRICHPSKLFNRPQWAKHMRWHTGITHDCPICQKKFTMKTNKKKHMLIHTGIKPLSCETCGKSFTHITNLKLHKLKSHLNKKPRLSTTCEQCGKTYSSRSALYYHSILHQPKKHLCNQCGQTFHYQCQLDAHIDIHNGICRFKCKYCDKAFLQRNALTSHIRIHTGEKPYKCNVCDKGFAQGATLKSHIRSHTGEKPYKCQYCDKSFSQPTHLICHHRTHTGERPYRCHLCHQTFALNGNLTKHMAIHTGENQSVCDICLKTFTHSSNMRKHRKRCMQKLNTND